MLCLLISFCKIILIVVIPQGQTGFPFVDAIMRQLRKEGWISSLARQVVGSFLTQGCMWMSWEEGFKVRKILLIKVTLCLYYDLFNACVANGGWMLKDLGTETNNPNPGQWNTP